MSSDLLNLFTILVIAYIVFGTWVEFKNPLWRKLSNNYKTEWISHKIIGATTLYLWDKEKNSWLNHVYIDVSENGLGIYPPRFKRYMSSILIPWDEIDINGRVYKGVFQGLRFKCFSRLQLTVRKSNVILAIPYRYHKHIEKLNMSAK